MHVKNDFGHRDGERYATLEKLQLVLALESSSAISKPSMGASGDGAQSTAVISVEEELHSCCCLLPCPPECSRNRSASKTQSDSHSSSSSSLSALHAVLLEAADRHADEQRAAVVLVGRIDDILGGGVDVNVTDERGETALSYVKILLRKGCFRLAHQVASHLLDHGALVDAEDNGQQTLLSHSVAALDGASDLTRLLLNRGADVWHRNGTGGDSPFGSFLQAIVRCRCVSGATITADLLGRTMGSRPEAFKALVLRSMLRHGRFIRVLGPVFVQLKSILSPYWRQPQPLRYAAWTVIRRHSSPVKSWARELQQMGLPPSVLRYLTMED
ncbi:uncharacterized protein LOC124337107 [Daphnia pulicaria]|uniref:uncharacterized protein LOC124337107 n=1 Tax=Daphnia pulicaria TaxID=35523 RepID=UPI001EEB5EE5|nr:uncharacterized protein LOC124337107 [Daphnia pulicaria]